MIYRSLHEQSKLISEAKAKVAKSEKAVKLEKLKKETAKLESELKDEENIAVREAKKPKKFLAEKEEEKPKKKAKKKSKKKAVENGADDGSTETSN